MAEYKVAMSKGAQRDRTGPVTEVEFSVHDTAYPFVGLSETDGYEFELAEMIPRPDGRYSEFFTVTGGDPGRILDLAQGHDGVDASLLCEYDDSALVEFVVSGSCPAFTLAELGALPTEVTGADGEGTIAAEIPPRHDASEVVEAFLERTSDAELTTKREKDSFAPRFPRSAFQQVLDSHLTDRQREVLETAFEAGYYECPRECTGQEVAQALGITSATFSEHVQAAERKLLTALFEGAD